MAWHQTGDKPLPDQMITAFTDAYASLCLDDWKVAGQENVVNFMEDPILKFWLGISLCETLYNPNYNHGGQ